MRKTLNENPVVQVVMLGILGIVVAFMFMTRVMGGDEAAEPDATGSTPTTAATAPGAAPATTPTTSTTPAATSTPTTPTAPAPTTNGAPAPGTSPLAAEGTGFEAGAGLPKGVVSAYERGDVVALLVVNSRAAEDKRLKTEIQALRGRGDTTVFVAEAKDVARYSRIAEGVNLDRVPALVVIEPKRLADGGLPAATISYGFRGTDSVQQAVRDVLYKGKDLPYHPG